MLISTAMSGNEMSLQNADMPPFFSVVIPTYNRSQTISATLDSLRAQTMADFECIVVDDGSEDSTELARVISEMGDERFKLVRQNNGGGGSARNTGIDASRARYVAFLDSDDFFVPHKLAACRQEIERLSFDLANIVIFTQVIVDRGESRTWIKPSRAPLDGELIDEYLVLRGGFIQTSTIVLERSIARTVRFDETLPFGQDTDFCIRLAAFGCRFLMLAEPLAIWSDQAVPNRVSNSRRVDSLLAWTDRVEPIVSRKSYLAYRGWHGAKAASASRPGLAFRLYLKALTSGAFTPALALRVALQVALPSSAYRDAANLVVRLFGKNSKGAP